MSSEYGWTTEYIFSRTTREISLRVQAISARLKRRFDLDLALHDKKLSEEEKEESEKDLSVDQVKLMDEALKNAKARHARKFKDRTHGSE